MASEADDIDAGWDDEPAPARDESVPPLPLDVLRATPLGSSESLSPSEVEVEAGPPSATSRDLPRFVGPLAVVAVLAAGTVIWFQRATAPAPAAAPPLTARELETPGTPPVAPIPAPALEAPSTPTLAPSASPDQDSSATALGADAIAPLVLYAPESVKVTVRSVPEGARFFESRKQLGTGVVSVSLGYKSKRWLTALLDGYEPLNFTLDASQKDVTVTLTPKR